MPQVTQEYVILFNMLHGYRTAFDRL